MTVSIDSTSKKYHGRKAETYEEIRTKQRRWHLENWMVRRMLKRVQPESVLDVPVGTGRYISLYNKLGVKRVLGIDISSAMLLQAKQKAKRAGDTVVVLKELDVRNIAMDTVDVSVCVRFLDLIDEVAMRQVMKKLMKVSRRAIICTIRLGPAYVPKSNTATHDEYGFRGLLKKHGWRIVKQEAIFTQGWYVLLLKRRSE